MCSETSGAFDWPLMRQLVAIPGAPISLSFMLEYGLFSTAALLMGLISTLALAAHQVALQVTAVLFMVPYGISQAATVRVGHAVGRVDAQGREARRPGGAAARHRAFDRIIHADGDRRSLCDRAACSRERDGSEASVILTATLLLIGRHLLHRRRRTEHRARLAARHERHAGTPVVRCHGYWLIGFPTACILAFWAWARPASGSGCPAAPRSMRRFWSCVSACWRAGLARHDRC